MPIPKKFLFSLLFFTSLSSLGISQEFTNPELQVNLKDPEFSHGVVSTDKGGIVSMGNLRIQAQKIEYIDKIENGTHIQKVVAEGNLLLEYEKQFFVGSKLEYDLTTKKGTIWDGKTFTGVWFLGGDKIDIEEDGTIYIHNAYITTSENQEKTWNIDASRIKVSPSQILTAEDIKIRFVKIPLFWFPSFKTNLKMFSSSPVRYKVVWDKGLNAKLSARYRVFASEYSDVYARLDYRINRGFGGAIESEYYSDDGRSSFLTKNYVAQPRNKVVPDEDEVQGETNKKRYHYRFQGMFHSQSQNEKTVADLTWDKLSDNKLPGDFKNDDFEINTQKRTLLRIQHVENISVSSFRIQPRINSFQSINQELPLAAVGIHPLSLGSSGIISQNNFQVGYLDYVFAKELSPQVSNFDSVRLSTRNELYRPIPLKYFTLTPHVGYVGIFYSNTPKENSRFPESQNVPARNSPTGPSRQQSILSYGVDTNTRFFHTYSKYRHMIEPYVFFQGLTHPTAGLDDHYIFNIDDGYVHINMLRVGVRNSLYKRTNFTPTFVVDTFSYAFFHQVTYHTTFPKAYTNFSWNLPSLNFKTELCWNVAENVLDYSNFLANWTVNAHLALGLEYRHRSKFDWRKSDRENFVIDFARPLEELLHSPISDGRNTFLGRVSARLSPKWSAYYECHVGWGRRHEPNYDSQKIELVTMLTTHWKARVCYEHMPNDDRFTWKVSLVN
ncbi:MAG: LPS-assembly protein LptD [Chlamydiae bacterium]|nr:LPS-assembly protein LptD [Chlamydiota bacterium]